MIPPIYMMYLEQIHRHGKLNGGFQGLREGENGELLFNMQDKELRWVVVIVAQHCQCA